MRTYNLSLKEVIENYKNGDIFKTYIDEDSYSPPIVRLENMDLIVEECQVENTAGKSLKDIMTLYGLSLMRFMYIGENKNER